MVKKGQVSCILGIACKLGRAWLVKTIRSSNVLKAQSWSTYAVAVGFATVTRTMLPVQQPEQARSQRLFDQPVSWTQLIGRERTALSPCHPQWPSTVTLQPAGTIQQRCLAGTFLHSNNPSLLSRSCHSQTPAGDWHGTKPCMHRQGHPWHGVTVFVSQARLHAFCRSLSRGLTYPPILAALRHNHRAVCVKTHTIGIPADGTSE